MATQTYPCQRKIRWSAPAPTQPSCARAREDNALAVHTSIQDDLIDLLDHELQGTRKMLERVPEGR